MRRRRRWNCIFLAGRNETSAGQQRQAHDHWIRRGRWMNHRGPRINYHGPNKSDRSLPAAHSPQHKGPQECVANIMNRLKSTVQYALRRAPLNCITACGLRYCFDPRHAGELWHFQYAYIPYIMCNKCVFNIPRSLLLYFSYTSHSHALRFSFLLISAVTSVHS